MIVNDEIKRQDVIRSMDNEDELEDASKLYEKGWSIVDIAESKGVGIRNVINALRGYVSVKPEDIETAEQLAAYEEEAERLAK